MEPAALILCLPIGDSELLPKHALENASSYELGSSAISMDVSPDRAHRGFSVVPVASLLNLGNRFRYLRALRLRCIILKTAELPASLALDHAPHFAALESLTIIPGFAQIPGQTPITASLGLLFPHMPRLRDLTVYAPLALPHYEPNSGLPYPDPAFSLKRLICVGGLSIAACAHIIAHSRKSLEELKINVGMSNVDADETHLVTAIAQAAPRLRVLDLRLRGSADLRPVLAALARVETLRLELPLLLQDALALVGGCSASLRELNLWCTLYSFEHAAEPAAQLSAFLSRAQLLKRVTLRGFDIGDEDLDELLKLCRARRIRCNVIG